MVFKGVAAAMLYKVLLGMESSGLWRETATWFRTGKDGKIPDATLSCDVTPEYLGLGYIIGPASPASSPRAASSRGSR